MTLTGAVSGLRVNTYSEGTGPRLVCWSEFLSPGATYWPNEPPRHLSLCDTTQNRTHWRPLLVSVEIAHVILILITVEEVGCYCRTSLYLLHPSSVPLWKSKFSKAPFRCSSAFLLLGLETLSQGGTLRQPRAPLPTWFFVILPGVRVLAMK